MRGSGLRVAYFAEIFPSKSETWVHHEIRALQQRGCDVRVFAASPKPSFDGDWAELERITVYLGTQNLGKRIRGLFRCLGPRLLAPLAKELRNDAPHFRQKAQLVRDVGRILSLRVALDSFDPAVSICHFAGTRSNLGLYYQWLTGTPFVVKAHASDVFRRVAMLRTKVRSAKLFYTISHFNIDYMERHYPDVDTQRLSINRCGIPIRDMPFDAKHKLGSPLQLLAVGRLVPKKGFDVLVRAVAELGADFPCNVLVVGDGPEREKLQGMIDHHELGGRVSLNGYSPPEQVQRLLRESDAMVLPCILDRSTGDLDGIPVALMEAMALGVPVISTRVSGIPELIDCPAEGFLAEPGDAADLARAISALADQTDEARLAMLRRARSKVAEQFDADLVAESFLDDLRLALGNS